MVPEALRRVQEPIIQTTPKLVQKQQGEGQAEEARCQQKAEKENLIQNLNSDRGADAMFFPPKWKYGVHIRQEKTGNFPETNGVSATA